MNSKGLLQNGLIKNKVKKKLLKTSKMAVLGNFFHMPIAYLSLNAAFFNSSHFYSSFDIPGDLCYIQITSYGTEQVQ